MVNRKYFFLNGQQYCTEYELTILEILNYFDYNSGLLVLEYNNLICNRNHWKNLYLKNGDKIEIVTIVGGG